MTKHLAVSGLLAGFAVALLAALLQFAVLERGILLAERYETGELQHFGGAGHDHAAHDHASAPASFCQRQAKTLLTMTITYCGYGILMVAGMALATHFSRKPSRSEGLLWGLAGFTAFFLAPAQGLPPVLPGVETADLAASQGWWLLCAVATAAGLALLAYGSGLIPRLAAVVLIALPHIIGAPHLADFTGVLPPELAAQHAARSLGVGLAAWVTLGGLAQYFWTRAA